MTSAPRFAFVGPVHAVSPWLFHAIRRHGTFEAVCDDHEVDAARYQARWTFNSLTDLLRESEPTGVIVVAPVKLRAKLIRDCLSAGAGVLILGAPGSTAAWKRMASLTQVTTRPILAESPLRFSPVFLLARRLIESGKMGRVISINLRSTRAAVPRSDFSDDSPVSADQIYEAASIIHYLGGPVSQVCAYGHEEGVLIAAGRTSAGVPMSIALHSGGPSEAIGIEFEMCALDGTRLQIDRNCRLFCGNGARLEEIHEPSLSSADPIVELGYDGLMGEFRRLLTAGRPQSQPSHVEECLQTLDGILTSCARGKSMTIRGESAAEHAITNCEIML